MAKKIEHNGNTIVEHDGEYYVEVDREAKVGDLVIITKTGTHDFAVGAITEIDDIEDDGIGQPYVSHEIEFGYLFAHEFNVLEPIAQHYTEVERKANEGELVKVVDSLSIGQYVEGGIYVAEEKVHDGRIKINGLVAYPEEYVVLEPKENAEAQPEEERYGIGHHLDLIANLARRVNTLEQDANNFRHDLRKFGEQTEGNTQELASIAQELTESTPAYFSPFQADLLTLCHHHKLPRDLALDLVEAAEYAEGERIERAIEATQKVSGYTIPVREGKAE